MLETLDDDGRESSRGLLDWMDSSRGLLDWMDSSRGLLDLYRLTAFRIQPCSLSSGLVPSGLMSFVLSFSGLLSSGLVSLNSAAPTC